MNLCLKQEVIDLGFTNAEESHMSVSLQGTLQDCMKLNLFLRTGHSVLFLIKEFPARTPDDLYKEMIEIPWEEYIDLDGYFSVTSFSAFGGVWLPRVYPKKYETAQSENVTIGNPIR